MINTDLVSQINNIYDNVTCIEQSVLKNEFQKDLHVLYYSKISRTHLFRLPHENERSSDSLG